MLVAIVKKRDRPAVGSYEFVLEIVSENRCVQTQRIPTRVIPLRRNPIVGVVSKGLCLYSVLPVALCDQPGGFW